MLFQILLLITSLLASSGVGLILYSLVMSQLAYVSFKRKTRGLPMLPRRQLIGNHFVGWILGKNNCRQLLEAHRSFHSGKTIGFVYNHDYAVSTTDLDLIKLMIHDEPNRHLNRYTVGLPLKEYEASIMLADADKWPKLRRAFAPALKSNKFKQPNVMQEIERSIEKLINMIDAKLDKQAAAVSEGQTFKVDDLIHRYTLNLVFSCFYKQYDLINFDDKRCRWTELVDEGLESAQTSPFIKVAILFPLVRPLVDWLIYNFHSQGVWRKSIANFVWQQTKLGAEARKQAQLLEKRRKEGGEKVDMDNFLLSDGTKFSRNMIDHVISQFLDGKLTRDEYFNTSCFLVGAADKTAADCLVHTLYQLASNQAIQERLRKSVQLEGIESEYLDWVLKESLRYMPPAPVGCSRTTSCDIEIGGGYLVPKNTFVVTCAYVIHRLKEYWGEDADEFKPERWADTSKHHPMQYIPFGAGPRGCPGKDFAIFVIKELLLALLTRYRFECNHGNCRLKLMLFGPARSNGCVEICRTISQAHMSLPLHEYKQSLIQAKGDDWRAFAPAFNNKFKHPNVVQEIERSIEKLVNMIDAKLDERAKVTNENYTFDYTSSPIWSLDRAGRRRP